MKPSDGGRKFTTFDNFIRKVDSPFTSGCWIWRGSLSKDGYGTFFIGKGCRAHRASYMFFVGDIPEGMTLHHTCNVRNCVNPAHLEPMPIGDNVMLGDTLPRRNLSKTHCLRGHEYSEANTYYTPINAECNYRNRRRSCRACRRQMYAEKWPEQERTRRV